VKENTAGNYREGFGCVQEIVVEQKKECHLEHC
jgi:hypothetical protein